MILTRAALGNPVAALVAVLMLVLFGGISLSRLPVQLTPEVERPEITVSTNWRAASPKEVESEILEPQEKVLRGTPGMVEMLSKASRGSGSLTLAFEAGADLQRALIDVLNRLNRIGDYPEDAVEPQLSTIGARNRPVAWFSIKTLPGNTRDVESYRTLVEELVQTRIERVPGVAKSEVRGGRGKELRISFDPYKLAALGVELPDLMNRVAGNEDVSAGQVDVGKRRYTIRFAGTFPVERFGEMIVDWRDGQPVLLRDVATIELRQVDRGSFVINQGTQAIAINAYRETGTNVLRLMQDLRQVVDELAPPLHQAGLSIQQVYDETVYIDRSINMLAGNLLLGILLSVGILWWFLRRLRATLIIAAAIPLCLLAAFIFIDVSAHTLNVISLAGLALAVGMVLDAGIVVLENVVRLRESGMNNEQAALQGANQVWGALLASTATTVAVFLPVIFLVGEAGQLFADLAIAISAAVIASLLISLVLVPVAAQSTLARVDLHDRHAQRWRRFADWIMRHTQTRGQRWRIIILLFSIPILLTVWLMPEADYLPSGHRNRISVSLSVAPGVNVTYIEKELGQVIARRIDPYFKGEKQPKVDHYFIIVYQGGAFMGVRAADPDRVDELLPVINKMVQGFPDTLAYARQSALFGGMGGGGSVEMNLQSGSLGTLLDVARLGYEMLEEKIPGVRVRAQPGLEMAQPELLLLPDERRLAEAGWSRQTLARISRAFGSGQFAGEYFDGERQRDIVVRTLPWKTPEELLAMPVVTPGVGVLPLQELVKLERSAGPEQIRRLDRRRTVTLQITPPAGMSLERLLDQLHTQVEPELLDRLPADGAIRYSGSAEKLQTVLDNMSSSFLLAVIILYLLMSALFRSFLDSLLVLLVLPLAAVGGVIALRITNLLVFQPMDLLTMIGFIIVLGLVVNNAILLVYQTRSAERAGMTRSEAVEQAVQIRLRPILMSALTSLFGMLPLLLMPGAGTELYRGLAATIVGGLAVSTVFTLILLPALLRMGKPDASLRAT